MKQIIVNNHLIMLDDEDFDYINQFTWCIIKQGNNKKRAYNYKLKNYMHRIIMKCPKGYSVDHIDGNPLNNQKLNLRICLLKDNSKNSSKHKNTTSKYKGVHFENYTKKWKACIKVNYKTINLGRFSNELEAAKAYDNAAIKYFGEFAGLNFKV